MLHLLCDPKLRENQANYIECKHNHKEASCALKKIKYSSCIYEWSSLPLNENPNTGNKSSLSKTILSFTLSKTVITSFSLHEINHYSSKVNLQEPQLIKKKKRQNTLTPPPPIKTFKTNLSRQKAQFPYCFVLGWKKTVVCYISEK